MKTILAAVILSSVLGIAATGLSGCQWKPARRPSYLVIAVDRLGVNHGGCRAEKDDATRSGLAELCEEGVRFTHAFTTSTLSAPAMGSILTGMPPYRSGLRHNGKGELGTLSASAETVAERALELGYRTLFVSGGPPLIRRTGLHQGFEVFEDSIVPNATRLHRPAREVVDIFVKWLEGGSGLDARPRSRVENESFFAVLHMADLQFPWNPMPDDSGRVRESTVKGQIEEVDQTLARLWKYLRDRKLWEHTTIVVVGLQGDSEDSRAGEIPALDLHSDTTHVALLIKEASRVPGATGGTSVAQPLPGQPDYNWAPKSWSFDVNVSLADVGVTLRDWLEGRPPESTDTDEAKSLRSALLGPGEAGEEWRRQDRLIVSESGWARWQLNAAMPIRVAFRRGPYLYLHDDNRSTSTIYNTLTDAFEVSPLPRKNARTQELLNEFSEIASRLGFSLFPGVDATQILEDRWSRAFFSNRLGARSGSGISVVSETDQLRMEILAETSQAAKVWMDLQRVDNGEVPTPTVCSQLVFKAEVGPTLSTAVEAELARVCPFRGAREIAKWIRMSESAERARVFEVIFKTDQQRIMATRSAEGSHAIGRVWETGSTRRKDLEGLEVLLAQPEAARLRQALTRRSRIQPEL